MVCFPSKTVVNTDVRQGDHVRACIERQEVKLGSCCCLPKRVGQESGEKVGGWG